MVVEHDPTKLDAKKRGPFTILLVRVVFTNRTVRLQIAAHAGNDKNPAKQCPLN